jgi:transposase
LAARDAAIATLTASNAELRVMIADLERRLGRNSGNSSMPPSSDDRPGVNSGAAGGERRRAEAGEAARRPRLGPVVGR